MLQMTTVLVDSITSSLWEHDNMLAKAQVELHLLHYGLIMASCKSYTNGLALIKLHTELLWQPESLKGKFFTDIPTLTEENVAERKLGLKLRAAISNCGMM